MLILNGLTIRNFMSIGNVTQSINFSSNDLVLVLGENLDLGGNDNRNGVGKAQPLYSKIKTPVGWVTMGDIKIGDNVSTPDGNSAPVTHIFPQGKKDIYRVTFADGRFTDVCKDHLWKTYSHSYKYVSKDLWKTVATGDIIDNINKHKDRKNKSTYYTYVPLITDISPDKVLPLDPYLMGALLGDGSFRNLGFTTADVEIANTLANMLPENTKIVKSKTREYEYGFKCINHTKTLPLTNIIKDLGLWGTHSHTKFIPEIYKTASVRQKENLIAGLVDTDGHIGGRGGAISISTSSEQMAKDIQEIIWSIGGIAKITSKIPYYTYKGVKKAGKRNFSIAIRYCTPKNLANLSRKKDAISDNYQYKDLKLRIDKIELISQEDAQCIMIDHPDHLYITDNFVVTHNSTIVNALSYALYGTALTNIKKDNLINKTNMKNMLVTLTFEMNGVSYKIERGRKPGIFKFSKNGVEKESTEDESQGEGRHTQAEIERLIGVSHDMFKHILALNTYVEPFLALRTNDQRVIIEQLLGITKLSEKADKLKEAAKVTKDEIKEEEFRITAATEANRRIEQNISSLHTKSAAWDRTKTQKTERLQASILSLLNVTIDDEIALHKAKKEADDLTAEYRSLTKELSTLEREVTESSRTISRLEKVLVSSVEKICPTCDQEMDKDTHDKVHNEYLAQQVEAQIKMKEKSVKRDDVKTLAAAVLSMIPELPTTFYSSIEEAYDHKTTLDTLGNSLASEIDAENPFVEQITTLKRDGIQEIDFTVLNNLVKLRDHQEFLTKLLTNKDSFIRKKIIDQNLTFLNHRLGQYLTEIGLPHLVKFKSDLEVEITMYGKEFDFDNLSRGERTRLILSLSWAFRDVFESMNDKINLLFIDELIDSGLDSSGVESSLAILKKMGREHNRNIFLISHRDELIGRVSNVLKVVKEGGFTSLEETASTV